MFFNHGQMRGQHPRLHPTQLEPTLHYLYKHGLSDWPKTNSTCTTHGKCVGDFLYYEDAYYL